MIRIAITVLLGSLLLVVQGVAEESAAPSTTPNDTQSQAPSAEDNLPPASPPVTRATPQTLFKICGMNPPPCATAPSLIKSPPPKYSKKARRNKIQGIVVLWLIVGADGIPRDIRVARSIGYGLDEEAIKTVKKWKFRASTFNGQPVAVQVNVEVAFHLY